MRPVLCFLPGFWPVLVLSVLLSAGADLFAQNLRVLSWNVQNYQDPRFASPDTDPRPKPEAAIVEVISRIVAENPQVVLLCEIANPASLRGLQARLAEQGLDLPHSHIVEGPDADRRLALLSVLPITQSASHGWVPFDLGAEPLYLNRGILDVTLQSPGNRLLRFVGCHLKSRIDHHLDEDEIRRMEAWMIRKHLEETVFPAGVPVIVWGDFNADRNSPMFRNIQGNRGETGYLTELRLEDDQGERWTYLWEPVDQYTRVDFLLVSRQLNRAVDGERSRVVNWPAWAVASDHRPLLLHLNLEEIEP